MKTENTLAQIGQLKKESVTCAFLREHGTNYPAKTSWSESVELLPFTQGEKTRRARVWLNLHGGSQVWERVFVMVRVPAHLIESQAVCAAANKAHHYGAGYSWILWCRGQIKQKYPRLIEDQSFKDALRRLSSEWMPRISEEGRAHITKTLKLPSFTVTAYQGVPRKATALAK